MNKDRNRLAGPAYERELVKKINGIGIFPKVDRSADVNPDLDKRQLDIVPIDPKMFDEFMYLIQAKTSTRTVPYGKLLSTLKAHNGNGVPVIFHKQTTRVAENRFLPTGSYAILEEKDFLSMITELYKYKKGFEDVIGYFDSISDEEQPKLHKRLSDLGL